MPRPYSIKHCINSSFLITVHFPSNQIREDPLNKATDMAGLLSPDDLPKAILE
jgi:hypothetical protein